MKYRKKPVVIEAIQFTGSESYNRMATEWGTPFEDGTTSNDLDAWLTITTLEGGHKASPGDWIIKGVKGEFYPCKPDIFAMTYEAVT